MADRALGAVTVLTDLDTHRLRKRLRELKALQRRLAAEVLTTKAALAGMGRGRHPYNVRPPCGTDKGYQWHRYHEPWNWPLPKHDPCGCKAAHTAVQRARVAERKRKAAS